MGYREIRPCHYITMLFDGVVYETVISDAFALRTKEIICTHFFVVFFCYFPLLLQFYIDLVLTQLPSFKLMVNLQEMLLDRPW